MSLCHARCCSDACSEYPWLEMMLFIGFLFYFNQVMWTISSNHILYAVVWVLSFGKVLHGAKCVSTSVEKIFSYYCYCRHQLWKHMLSCFPTRQRRCVIMCECCCGRMCDMSNHCWCIWIWFICVSRVIEWFVRLVCVTSRRFEHVLMWFRDFTCLWFVSS